MVNIVDVETEKGKFEKAWRTGDPRQADMFADADERCFLLFAIVHFLFLVWYSALSLFSVLLPHLCQISEFSSASAPAHLVYLLILYLVTMTQLVAEPFTSC